MSAQLNVRAKVQGWGNSQGIRINKAVLESVNWQIGDEIIIQVSGDSIIMEKAAKPHRMLRERFASYNGNDETQEWDTGEPVGDEVLE